MTSTWTSTSIPFNGTPRAIPPSTITYAPITLQLPIEEVTYDGKRWYLYEGQQYPSVTNMISATDTEGRAALTEWRRRIGHSAATSITQNAAKRGTQWHAFCEQFVTGESVPWSLFTEPTDSTYAAHIAETLNAKIRSVLVSETRVVSSHYGLAGRMDMAIQLHDGRYAILDFKTGKKLKSGNRLLNYALQCTFYADALTEHWSHGTIDTIIIAQLLPDRIVWQETSPAPYRVPLQERVKSFATMVNTQLE